MLFAYIFNDLRESSTMSILTEKVTFSTSIMTARVSVSKVMQASQEKILFFRHQSQSTSPVDVISRWETLRCAHTRFFAMADDSITWEQQSLTADMQRVFRVLLNAPPPYGKHTSHSIKIGAHTEQVLLVIPLEAILARSDGSTLLALWPLCTLIIQ